jgi:glucan phosphoethanolaminetransferase (alkaline phosphatase superfamily)
VPAMSGLARSDAAFTPMGLTARLREQFKSLINASGRSVSLGPGQRKVLPWVGLAVGLLVLPNAQLMLWPKFMPLNGLVLLQAAGLVLLPCLLRLPVRVVLLAWLPFVLMVPAVVGYQATMQNPVRAWAFLVLIETNAQEVETFIKPMVAVVVLALPVAALYWWIVMRKIPRSFRLGLGPWLAVYALAGLVPIYGGWDVMWERVSDGYPVGTIIAGWKAAGLRRTLATRGLVRQDYTARPAPDVAAGEREVHVLVIGEAARYASFQINGYGRETTPLLAANTEVLSFHHVSAPATCTLYAVPLILTLAKVPTVDRALTMPSCIQVFSKAGYKTYWLSTQRKHGKFDTTVSAFARDADNARFLSGELDPGGAIGKGARYDTAPDAALLPCLQEILNRREPRVLLVLHTMGSHMPYQERYPEQANYFHADKQVCDSVQNLTRLSPPQIEEMTKAYDNTVRYTDWVLSQVINLLAAQHALGTCLYVSDHGENSGHASRLPFAHGEVTEDVIHVPMFVWLSPEYRAHRPAQTAALQAHRETVFSSNSTFHTLVDLAAIQCDLLDRSQSAASPDFEPAPCLVAH